MQPEAMLSRAITAAWVATNGEDVVSQKFCYSEALQAAVRSIAGDSAYYSRAEISLLSRGAIQLYTGERTEAAFVASLIPYVEDRYVYAGLDRFNIRLSPLAYTLQDYSNAIGSSYAQFVSAVSQKVTRQRNEKNYGAYFDYQMQVLDPQDFKRLMAFCSEADAPFDNVAYLPGVFGGESVWTVQFAIPLGLEWLQSMLAWVPNNGLMLRTLKLLSPQ